MKTAILFAFIAFLAGASLASADIVISEVAPWSSGNSPVAADWFELTNTGSSAVNISGWTIDDDSNNSNSALLTGITSIAAGESVIFIDLAAAGNAATLTNTFRNNWFGANPPAGLQIGTYTAGVAGGVGLGTGGDQVNIFSGVNGTLQANVLFGTSDATTPFQTFDNSAGANNITLTTLSVTGVNGAFTAPSGNEVGSPGIASVPEPSSLCLLGLGAIAFVYRRRVGVRPCLRVLK